MKARFLYLTLLVATALSMSFQAAQPTAPAKPWQPTRLSDGQPDIQGMWGNLMGPIAGLNIEPGSHLLKQGAPAYPALKGDRKVVVDPPDGILPHQPWALARRNQAMKEFLGPSPAMMDTATRAWPHGIPRQNYYSGPKEMPIQIFQPPGQVVFFYEVQHEYRIVPLDGRPQPGKDITLWLGSSRGRWEGNTLVIDVTNHNDSTRFDVMGNFHTDEMKLTERWTIVDKDTLDYRATIDDPKVYTKPWTVAMTAKRGPAGNEILEYAGVEGEGDYRATILGR